MKLEVSRQLFKILRYQIQ